MQAIIISLSEENNYYVSTLLSQFSEEVGQKNVNNVTCSIETINTTS